MVIPRKLFICCVSVQMSVVREKCGMFLKSSLNLVSTTLYFSSRYDLRVFLH